MTLEEVLRDPENIPAVRRWLFEQLAAGALPAGQAAAVARRIGVELEAGGYAVALFDLPSRDAGPIGHPADTARRTLHAFFLKYSEYMPVQLSPGRAAVLIKGERRRMDELTERCVAAVREQYGRAGYTGWHMAVSGPVDTLEALPACCREADRLWAMRHFRPEQQVFRPGEPELSPLPEQDARQLDDISPALTGGSLLDSFLSEGAAEDVPAFAAGYLVRLGGASAFLPLRHYGLLAARFAAERYLAGLGVGTERLRARLPSWETAERDPEAFLRLTLAAALSLRDEARGASFPGALGRAMAYVQERSTDPDLTLAAAAAAAGVTESHLSALFRRTMDATFTQYVTEKRMALARHLLLTTDMRPGQIAGAAGYRDQHYFSAVFKKVQGCTPTEFRAQNKTDAK